MNKKIILLLLVLVSVCAIAHVGAADISDISTDDLVAANDVKLEESSEDILTDSSQRFLANSSDDGTNNPFDSGAVVEKQTAIIKASKATVVYKKGTKWSLKLKDSNGKAIANKNIILKVYTGSKYKEVKVKTDLNGVAKYNTKSLNVGTHKIVANFVDDSYNCKQTVSSIKVIKQTALKIITTSEVDKDFSTLMIFTLNKKTNKFLNGVKLKVLIYTGKKYKTLNLKTKKIKEGKGLVAYATNELSVGKHKVKITVADLKYKGSKTTCFKISKSAKKYPKFTMVISG